MRNAIHTFLRMGDASRKREGAFLPLPPAKLQRLGAARVPAPGVDFTPDLEPPSDTESVADSANFAGAAAAAGAVIVARLIPRSAAGAAAFSARVSPHYAVYAHGVDVPAVDAPPAPPVYAAPLAIDEDMDGDSEAGAASGTDFYALDAQYAALVVQARRLFEAQRDSGRYDAPALAYFESIPLELEKERAETVAAYIAMGAVFPGAAV